MPEYKLPFTGKQIVDKLNTIDNLATKEDVVELTEVIENRGTPTVSSADAGKFLRVSSNGKWIAESIANAEEVAF